MTIRFLPLLLLPLIGISQTNAQVELPISGSTISEKQPLEIKRNALYNLEEIKVRWKKAALENCSGVPCVVEPVTPPAPALACGSVSSVNDVDLNNYTTVSIGTLCWTKENLKVTRYNDGTAIPFNNSYTSGTVSTVWQGLMDGAYTIYNNETSSGANATNYGFLYNWYAAKGIATPGSPTYKNLCPTGYHVPTDSDWNILVKFIDSGADTSSSNSIQSHSAGTFMKSASALWNVVPPASPGTNTSDFSALPGGFRFLNGSFNGIRDFDIFWSATEFNITSAYSRSFRGDEDTVRRGNPDNAIGSSVRCLRD